VSLGLGPQHGLELVVIGIFAFLAFDDGRAQEGKLFADINWEHWQNWIQEQMA